LAADLERRRAIAFDSLPADEREMRIQAMLTDMEQSNRAHQFARMSPQKRREHAIYLVQKVLVSE
jgi:hypothetical protein